MLPSEFSRSISFNSGWHISVEDVDEVTLRMCYLTFTAKICRTIGIALGVQRF